MTTSVAPVSAASISAALSALSAPTSASGSASASTTAPGALSAAEIARTQLGSAQFLQLMLTQLKNQDPTKPLDSTQFVSQLAQMTQVTSLQGMQTSLTNLASSLNSQQLLAGSNLVGHLVLAPGSAVSLGASGSAGGAVTVAAGTTALQINVIDSTGQLVRQMALAPQTGTQEFTWDGNTDAATRAAAGSYSFQAVATRNGQTTSIATQIATQVQSVSVDSSTNKLTLNTADLGSINLSDVTQIF